jgi:hypothetical protein
VSEFDRVYHGDCTDKSTADLTVFEQSTGMARQQSVMSAFNVPVENTPPPQYFGEPSPGDVYEVRLLQDALEGLEDTLDAQQKKLNGYKQSVPRFFIGSKG